jgi:hypothetical protein
MVEAAIQALRERGAPHVDPVRFRLIESLARRAASHEGAARRVLDDRLAVLLSACGQALDRAGSQGERPPTPAEAGPVPRGPLADLVAGLARQAPIQPTAQAPAAAVELDTLPFFRRTWSRLSADQRLAQSQAALPGNAGPLNSHHLVHRSLTLMRDLSPGYFDRFVAHVDALLSLQQGHKG